MNTNINITFKFKLTYKKIYIYAWINVSEDTLCAIGSYINDIQLST